MLLDSHGVCWAVGKWCELVSAARQIDPSIAYNTIKFVVTGGNGPWGEMVTGGGSTKEE